MGPGREESQPAGEWDGTGGPDRAGPGQIQPASADHPDNAAQTRTPRRGRARPGPEPSGRAVRDGRGRRGRDRPVPDDPEHLAREVCLRLLATAPRTRAQLAAALTRRGVPEDAFAPILDRFTDVGLIDDRAFARAWVTSRHHGRGLARRALAAELRGRGVDGELIDDAVAELDPAAEEETARALVRRKLAATAQVDPLTRTRRLLGVLARKGYPPGLAYRVVREVLEERGAGPDGAWPDEPIAEEP